ncbi:hypothetical protein Tco_1281264 [Tanacetum coccineum]
MFKIYNLCTNLVDFANIAPLPPRDQRHLWLRYQVKGYTKEIVHDFEQSLKTIFGRQVNQVHILDFEGLTPDMRQDLAERLRMVYTGKDGQEIFMSHSWRRHAEGRKRDAKLSGGHFIGRLAHHFGLVSNDRLRGLSIVTRELPLIDMGELVKLNIYVDEGAQAGPAPIHAPPPPAPAAAGRTFASIVSGVVSRDGTFRSELPEVFKRTKRHTRQRTDDASTSIAQQDEQQPDP